MAIIIDIENLVTRFGDHVVHNGLNLHVNQGEIYGLLGPSGCGKTTLLREMLLLEPISSGKISILGKDLSTLNPHAVQNLRQQWGMLFQGGALFSSLSIADNIALPLREYTHLSEKMIAEIVAFKIDIVGLKQDVKLLYPSQLSGGMTKKAALARALALDPKLLFLDEPTSGLDPISARDFDALIVKLKEMLDLTVVMVSHDLESIRMTLDRMAIIDDQKIVAEGTFHDIMSSNSPFVTMFFKGIHE